MRNKQYPVCNRTDCVACKEEHCKILASNNFGERECPFFKTWEQNEEEIAYCRKVMNERTK